MVFIPETPLNTRRVPWFEESTEEKIAGADLRLPIKTYLSRIGETLSLMGGIVTGLTPGLYDGPNKRYGYRITFVVGGLPGRADVAALPIRTFTETKKDKALKQALFLFWKELDAARLAWVYKPGSMPLIPYLITASGNTVAEEVIEHHALTGAVSAGYIALGDGRRA